MAGEVTQVTLLRHHEASSLFFGGSLLEHAERSWSTALLLAIALARHVALGLVKFGCGQ